ncbi:MAG: ABC transporter ATP-binding protein, partial [Gammaproteobacteria bacterium]|nr:ABC transporter ATP-binding protein [Gammaproteobacteria bacterium]
MSPLIELRGIGRVFEDEDGARTEALADVTLAIGAGELVCITGPFGSGKSTLLNILGCLDRPATGEYRFDGRDVTVLDADALARLRRDEFGFVFQAFNLLESATSQQNVELPARYLGTQAGPAHDRARKLLESLGLGDRLDHRPAELSGGEQQRTSIARALMNGGRIILADEPTGALDSAQGEEVMSLLKELAERGHTMLIVSHDAAVAAEPAAGKIGAGECQVHILGAV